MYKEQQAQAQPGGGEQGPAGGEAKPDDNVVDAEFEEVKDKK
jgi:molecular chaperone DnaK